MPLEIAIFHSSMTVGADDIRPYGADFFTSCYFGTPVHTGAWDLSRAQDGAHSSSCVSMFMGFTCTVQCFTSGKSDSMRS